MNTGQKTTTAYRHEGYPLGKTTVESSVRVETVGDLAMAYSPGVAQPCLAIAKNPDDVYRFTGKGNLVAIIPTVRRFYIWVTRDLLPVSR